MKRVFVFALAFMFSLGSIWTVKGNELLKVEPMVSIDMGHQQELVFALDLGDMSHKSDTEISKEISDFLHTGLSGIEAELNCKVSVKGKVSVGLASIEITVEVSGPCSEIRSSGTQIAHQILAEVKRAIQAN